MTKPKSSTASLDDEDADGVLMNAVNEDWQRREVAKAAEFAAAALSTGEGERAALIAAAVALEGVNRERRAGGAARRGRYSGLTDGECRRLNDAYDSLHRDGLGAKGLDAAAATVVPGLTTFERARSFLARRRR